MTERLPKIKLAYIRRVLRFIERSDKRMFAMYTYGTSVRQLPISDTTRENFAPCGTRCCFGGWGYLLQFPRRAWEKKFDPLGRFKVEFSPGPGVAKRAAKLFGFTNVEAADVFCGIAMNREGWEAQFAALKESINTVLQNRGLEDRV